MSMEPNPAELKKLREEAFINLLVDCRTHSKKPRRYEVLTVYRYEIINTKTRTIHSTWSKRKDAEAVAKDLNVISARRHL